MGFPHTRGGVPGGVTFFINGRRFPHTRGGVPVEIYVARLKITFSPHAWGCTAWRKLAATTPQSFPHTRGGVPVRRLLIKRGVVVFPTRVGVYR